MTRRGWLASLFAASSPQAIAQMTPEFRSEVHLVRVPCAVTDAAGAPIVGLTQKDFEVKEDGRRRSVKYVWQEADLPLIMGLIVDVSGSQSGLSEQHQRTIDEFLRRLMRPGDRVFLVSVGLQQRLVSDLTGSTEALALSAKKLASEDNDILGDPCCKLKGRYPLFGRGYFPFMGTALWNGVYFSATLKLAQQTGRKALLLLTDGWDTGSDYRVREATEACQSADTVVYSIRHIDPKWLLPDTTQPLTPRMARGLRRYREGFFARMLRDLKRISRETGGEVYEGESANLPAMLQRIETALRTQYVLGYEQSTTEPGYHRLEVKVRRSGVKVRARTGYYAQ